MATKKVNLNEFKEIIKNIIKEEIVKENSSVEQNKIINQLKGFYKYSQEEAKELVKQNSNMNATAIHKKKQDNKTEEDLKEEIINEIKNDVRYEDIVDNINRVVTVFGGSVIKVIFNDNSSLTFDTNNGKRYQDSSERNKANFAVEIKRYIQKNHNGDNLKFLDEFQNFRNFRQTTESKKR